MNIDQATLSQPITNTKTSQIATEKHFQFPSMQQALKQVSSSPQAMDTKQAIPEPLPASQKTLTEEISTIDANRATNKTAREEINSEQKAASGSAGTANVHMETRAKTGTKNKKTASTNTRARTVESTPSTSQAETHNLKNITEADIKTLQKIDRLRLMRTNLNENRRSHTKSVTQYQMRQIREVDAKEEQVIADLNRLHEKYGDDIFKMLRHVQAPDQEAVAEHVQNQKFRKHRETTLNYLPHTHRSQLRKHADQFLTYHSNLPIHNKTPEEMHREIKQVFHDLRKSKPHYLDQ